MGNVGSNNSTGRRRHRGGRRSNHHTHHPQPPPQPPQPDIIFAAATPYPSQYTNPNPAPYYQYPTGAYYPPPPLPAVPLHDHHHRVPWVGGGRYPCAPVMHIPAPYVDHQKAVTIRNDVNIKKESLMIETDDENPGKFVVSFTFDATVACSITLYFFAKEGDNCNLTTVKENPIPPITLTFQQGLGQKFKQTPGTGIDLSAYDESELSKGDETSVYPLAVKAEAIQSSPEDGKQYPSATNSQITDAAFEKVKGEFKARVVKQILWVNGVRYELQEIYGIGNTVDGGKDFDGNDSSKECVICLSEPRDTTVLPCRHMCMCSGCAKVMRFQTNRCPICRQAVERLLEIKVNNRAEE